MSMSMIEIEKALKQLRLSAAAGARPLADMKYDASLPSLPSASRAALDLVVRERAWGRHRLDLLPASNASR